MFVGEINLNPDQNFLALPEWGAYTLMVDQERSAGGR
jgi:hypothetical protein